ncbi:HAMP domain-containing histidine kinase [Williamsia herbipolensis]|uniref:histidine kinase n=1 Tax=Williamsia herbipolensis TaxID=1603258 RepID=A0AAU4K404_9NOCA|nr:ATP-binding protein [Williamsia herbipolensis]
MRPPPRRIAATLDRYVGGVRIRLTILATVLLAISLAAAAVIMLLVLHRSLLNSADAATGARATEIAATVRTESPRGLDSATLTTSKDLDVIQVLDTTGAVIAATNGDRTAPLVPPAPRGTRHVIDGARIADNPAEYRATVVGVSTPTGDVTVVVGAAEGPINDVVTTVGILFASVFPVILVLLAANTYFLSGRTLRPVERIRAQVAAISSSDLSKRVTEPRTSDEIARLAATMNEMLARLETTRTAQLQFVGDASHELRSPLMTIVGLLDLSRTTDEPIDPATVTAFLLPEARRLRGMVDDLLLLAKADERGIPLHLDDVDLDDLVGTEAQRLTQLRTITITTHITPIRVRGDHDKLTRAIRNIADNALRYATTTIDLSMTRNDNAELGAVTITDDGPGIPPEHREKVFNRFVRLDTDRQRAQGGSGLGLAIVDEIIRAHHGTVSIGDTPSGGTQVTITVPTADD